MDPGSIDGDASDDARHVSPPLQYAEPAVDQRNTTSLVVGLFVALILLGLGLLWTTFGVALLFEGRGAPVWFAFIATVFGLILFVAGVLNIVGTVRRMSGKHERSAFFAVGYWFLNLDLTSKKRRRR